MSVRKSEMVELLLFTRVYRENTHTSTLTCSGVSFDTGGSTPNASHVSMMMLVGCPPIDGILALGIDVRG
jgi:hypothetical protein